MMTRTQISFDREMLRKAQDRARQLGISLAEYLRRLVADDLSRPGTGADPRTVFDLGSSGESDVARAKDAMLGTAFSRRGR
ncbi:MAG: hypothetical protein R3E10_10340 [Gemmatimonadota bacterium]